MLKNGRWITERTRGFYLAAYLLFALLVVGTLGFELIEGWTLLQSFYMTVITISTVGYGEVLPMSEEGRIFAAFFIIMAMSITVYAFGVIGQTALEGELFKHRRIAKMEKQISEMSDHIIVCGFGSLAHHVVEELVDHGEKIVIVEIDDALIEEAERSGLLNVKGNAHADDVLLKAGIKKAKTLLAILSSDAENVFITLSARNLNPKIHIIARTEVSSNEVKLRRAGADQIIAPYRVSGGRIVQKILHQHVNDFLEIVTGADGKRLALEQIVVPEKSRLTGKTLEEAALRKYAGVNVAAMISPSGNTYLNPDKDTRIESGARLILIGETSNFSKLEELFGEGAA
ncbi:MAG: potassium channel protein [Bdellovibrionales bacterium]|nr:potassium channel protein [Bdellovibrionales bacterium]